MHNHPMPQFVFIRASDERILGHGPRRADPSAPEPTPRALPPACKEQPSAYSVAASAPARDLNLGCSLRRYTYKRTPLP